MSYFQIFEIKSLSEREAILRNVRVLDAAYTEIISEKIKADTETKSAVAAKSSGR